MLLVMVKQGVGVWPALRMKEKEDGRLWDMRFALELQNLI
jgi:hypothetical protein